MSKETVEGLMALGKMIHSQGPEAEAKAAAVIEQHPGAGVVGLAVMLGMFAAKTEAEDV